MKLTSKKLLLVGFAIFSLSVSKIAKAENPQANDALQWIAIMGGMNFDDGGAAYLPQVVLSQLGKGRISPMMQLALTTHMMSQCTADVVKDAPQQLDPYVKAKAQFDTGLCRIQKCFQQAMLIDLISQTAANQSGGATNSQAAQVQAVALANAFKKDKGCSDGGGPSIDPLILALISGQAGN